MELLPIIYSSITIFFSLLTVVLLFSWLSYKFKKSNKKIQVKKDFNVKPDNAKFYQNSKVTIKKDLRKDLNNKILLDRDYKEEKRKRKPIKKNKKRIEVVDNLGKKREKQNKSVRPKTKPVNNSLGDEIFSKYSSSDNDDLKPINVKK